MEPGSFSKVKINNSYESEPSSGSGSSTSDLTSDLGSDVENMNLPYLLNPRTYAKQNYDMETTPASLKSTPVQTPAYVSSQESPFHGFNESPFGKLHLRLQKQNCEQSRKENGCSLSTETNKVTAGGEKFYDTIVSENSCNAVDIALASQEKCQAGKGKIVDQVEVSSSGNVEPPQAELSFNGKFKSLSVSKEEKSTTHVEVTLKETSEIVEGVASKEVNAEARLEVNNTSAKFSQSFLLRNYNNEKSPDLFADDDDDDEAVGNANVTEEFNGEDLETLPEIEEQFSKLETSIKYGMLDSSANRSFNCPTESSFADEPTMDCTNDGLDLEKRFYRDNCKRERELLRRIRKCLSGIPPPPSLTKPQMDIINMVISRKNDVLNFFQSPFKAEYVKDVKYNECNSLYKPTHSLDEAKAMPWRGILGVRQHGLSYNLTTASESNEYLSLSVVDRFVGTDTKSSYRGSPSSDKKRNERLKLLTKSPGNRLSHLAKRRAVFSSAHLATTSQKSTSSLGPQIIIDKKKIKNRRKATPKRRTPASKKKTRKTPSSSARKRLFRCDLNKPGPSRETSKRALFQSPAKQIKRQLPIAPKLQIKPEIATRVEKSKRALFSPEPNESLTSANSLTSLLKRKRSDYNFDGEVDDDEELISQSTKYLRASSENLTPRALKIKSQSFCIGAGSSTSMSSLSYAASTSTALSNGSFGLNNFSSTLSLSSAVSTNSLYCSSFGLKDKKLPRAYSDRVASTTPSLTENQRKKLLWAVSQALQEKKISTKHESFKQYASVLARVVRRIFQEYYQRTSTSNSETMLRLSKKYVYYVISGKTADEVYLQVKAEMDESKRMSTNRLTGYIGREEYQQLKIQDQQHQQQVQQFSLSSLTSSQSFLYSNENSFDVLSQSSHSTEQLPASIQTQQVVSTIENNNSKSASKLCPIETNPNQQNSSSKSNLGSLPLRENSAQKNFTGKDQRNISPYAKNSAYKPSTIIDSLHAASSAKAKRQIRFDS